MGALSEESAITVSSLSTDLWNNWTKNNAEGISFVFCSSLLCHLKPQTNKKKPQTTENSNKPKPNKNPNKIYYDDSCDNAPVTWTLLNFVCVLFVRWAAFFKEP